MHARKTLQELETEHASDGARAYSVGRATLLELYTELREITDAVPNHGHEGISRCYPWEHGMPDWTFEGRPFPRLTDHTRLEEVRYKWLAVYPVTGTNEGHYIHVELIWQTERKEGRALLFLLKTFGGQEEAIQLAGLLCRVLGV